MLQVIRCPLARHRCTLAERTEGETKKNRPCPILPRLLPPSGFCLVRLVLSDIPLNSSDLISKSVPLPSLTLKPLTRATVQQLWPWHQTQQAASRLVAMFTSLARSDELGMPSGCLSDQTRRAGC